jgi:hypothetical protein
MAMDEIEDLLQAVGKPNGSATAQRILVAAPCAPEASRDQGRWWVDRSYDTARLSR